MIEIFILAAIVLLAYTVKGTLGFGEGFVIISLFGFFLDIKLILPIALLLALLGGPYQAIIIRKNIHWEFIKPLVIPMILGVILGTYLITKINSKIVSMIFAVFLMIYSIRLLAKEHSVRRKANNYISGAISFLSGTIDAIIGVGGAPLIAYLDYLKYRKDVFRATIVFLFFILATARTVTYAYAGIITKASLQYTAYFMPAAIIGLVIGMLLSKKVNHTLFKKIVAIFLFITGAALIFRV